MTSVCVIEDDRNLRQALARLLGVEGYNVEQFASAEQFLPAAPTSTACCILLDVDLGGMSGPQLARSLCAAGLDFPIVFMTGSEDGAVLTEVRELGCPVLRKPFPADSLFAAVRTACETRVHRTPRAGAA
jgi:FixJ family two-component response regulator